MVSIIVPVYNAEKYLPRCIESILKQTHKEFELILVDDGSKDRSGKICDYYQKQDNRINVIHKENGGVSDARNVGIEVATGTYISFVDSDDWLEENYLEKLLSLMENNDAQLSIGSFDFRDLKISYLPKQPYDNIDFLDPIFEDCVKFFNSWLRYGPCVKIFCRDIIVNNNIKFNVSIKHGEDTLFVNEYLSNCNKIYITNDILYHYNRLVENSATRKFYNEFFDWNLTILTSLEKLLDKVNISSIEKKQIMDIIVVDRICNIVSGLVRNLPREEAISRISNTVSGFCVWILPEPLFEEVRDSRQKLRYAIKTKNTSLIYQEQKNLLNKNRAKKLAKKIIYKIATPIIERKRDGLIIFKG